MTNLFEKWLARFGMGVAKAEIVIAQHEIEPGSTLKGDIVIDGGEIAQTIEKLSVGLEFTYYDDSPYTEFHNVEKILGEKVIVEGLVIEKRKTSSIPFELDIPDNTPFTNENKKTHLKAVMQNTKIPNCQLRTEMNIRQKEVDNVLKKLTECGFVRRFESGKCFAMPNEEKKFEQRFMFHAAIEQNYKSAPDEILIVLFEKKGDDTQVTLNSLINGSEDTHVYYLAKAGEITKKHLYDIYAKHLHRD